jgi:hypothetical protein
MIYLLIEINGQSYGHRIKLGFGAWKKSPMDV